MQAGTVKFFSTDKGYGFIAPDNCGQDSFVHVSALQCSGLSTLEQGQRVRYELETDERRGKTSAVSIELA